MLSERIVRDAKSTGKAYTVWDGQVKGLGLQVTQGGKKNYVLRFEDATGRKRQAILARTGEISLKAIRERAGAELVSIRNGEADPMTRRQELREAPTVADLLDRFFSETVPARMEAGRMAPHTVKVYTSQARLYIRPLLGDYKVAKVTRSDVEVVAGKIKSLSQRNRTLQLLSRLFTQAERWDWRPAQSNPVRLVERAVERPRERVLSPSELSALAAALDGLETEQRFPVAAIRVAAMTGLRIAEVLGMAWERVNLETGRASLETKTGPRVVPLPAAVLELLERLPRRNGNPWVFAGATRKSHITYKRTHRVFLEACKAAGLADVRLHDLRRTLATRLAGAGVNAYILRDVLGHASTRMSNRYVRAASDALTDAVERGAALTAEAMGVATNHA